jgi:hypothetical protein
MDVKNALNQIIPIGLRTKEPVSKEIKSGSTTDRDANGQQAFSDNQNQHPPMSDEQLKKAIEHLKSLPVVKDHNLEVELIESEGKKFILLKEPDGKLIRRIPEFELWSLQIMKNEKKGQILNRSA